MFYRLQQLIIFVLHLCLLGWMIFILQESGKMKSLEVFLHFLGMSAMGAGLIYGCARWARYHHEKGTPGQMGEGP